MNNRFEEYFFKQYNCIKENIEAGNMEYLFECDNKFPKKKIVSKRGDSSYATSIHTYLLPQPFIGDIKKAKIIICSLNPGFSDEDCYIEEKSLSEEHMYPDYTKELLNQLNPKGKNKTMFWLTEKEEKSGGSRWWRHKLDQNDKSVSLVATIAKEYYNGYNSDNKEKVFKWLSENLAAIELFPYHSKKFSKSLLNKCESSKCIKNYVYECLIPEANKGKRLICFTRSLKDWGVENYNGENVILNSSVQNITFNSQLELGKGILNFIKDNSLLNRKQC